MPVTCYCSGALGGDFYALQRQSSSYSPWLAVTVPWSAERMKVVRNKRPPGPGCAACEAEASEGHEIKQ